MFFVQVRELCGKFEGTFLKIWYFVPFLRIFTNFYIVFALKWRVSAIFIPCHFTILREKLQTKMHKYTKNAGIVLFYTQNPAYLAAPVRLELTTHGLTELPVRFSKSLQAFIYKGFSDFTKFSPKFSPKFSHPFFGVYFFAILL